MTLKMLKDDQKKRLIWWLQLGKIAISHKDLQKPATTTTLLSMLLLTSGYKLTFQLCLHLDLNKIMYSYNICLLLLLSLFSSYFVVQAEENTWNQNNVGENLKEWLKSMENTQIVSDYTDR